MIYFTNCFTLGEIMGIYGKWARILTGILSFVNTTTLAGIQLITLGNISSYLLNIPPIYGVVISGIISVLYTIKGGMKSIAITSVIHFCMLIIAVPIIACTVVHKVGGIGTLFLKLPSQKFVVVNHERFYRYLIYFVIWLLQVGMIDPALVQRMLMAKSKKQLRNTYIILSIFDPFFRFLVMLIGLGGFILYPSTNANQIVIDIVQSCFPIGIKGIVVAGLLAIVLSSSDSYLHVAGLSFSHDVILPVFKKKFSSFNELLWTRYATIGAGIVAVMIGLGNFSISYLGFKALEIMAPCFLIAAASSTLFFSFNILLANSCISSKAVLEVLTCLFIKPTISSSSDRPGINFLADFTTDPTTGIDSTTFRPLLILDFTLDGPLATDSSGNNRHRHRHINPYFFIFIFLLV